jgi:hypothetical protein
MSGGPFTAAHECPLGADYHDVLSATDDMSLDALDLDAKGNVIFGGGAAARLAGNTSSDAL